MARAIDCLRLGKPLLGDENNAIDDDSKIASFLQKEVEILSNKVLSSFEKETIFPPSKSVENILLTGATGFVGAFLLRELLEQTLNQSNDHKNSTLKVYCLVRASNEEEGWNRLKRNLINHLLWDERFLNLLVPLPGDLSKVFFY